MTVCPGAPKVEDCKCLNIDPITIKRNVIRTGEVWMVVSLTIACLGIIICLSFSIWIACCKATICFTWNILDGSQGFTLLLLFGLILLLSSVFPYAVHANTLVCAMRVHCVPLSYAFVFSTMLSRSGNLIVFNKTKSYVLNILQLA